MSFWKYLYLVMAALFLIVGISDKNLVQIIMGCIFGFLYYKAV